MPLIEWYNRIEEKNYITFYHVQGGIRMTIKQIREKYDLTQAELANITGIPKRSIENWEMEVRKPADYIPDLVLSKVEAAMRERHKKEELENLYLGMERCDLRNYANTILNHYYTFLAHHNINPVTEPDNFMSKCCKDVWSIYEAAAQCSSSVQIRDYMSRLDKLNAYLNDAR